MLFYSSAVSAWYLRYHWYLVSQIRAVSGISDTIETVSGIWYLRDHRNWYLEYYSCMYSYSVRACLSIYSIV